MEKITYKDLSPFLKKCAIGGIISFSTFIASCIFFIIGIIFGMMGY